jgi:hypothetical protein
VRESLAEWLFGRFRKVGFGKELRIRRFCLGNFRGVGLEWLELGNLGRFRERFRFGKLERFRNLRRRRLKQSEQGLKASAVRFDKCTL